MTARPTPSEALAAAAPDLLRELVSLRKRFIEAAIHFGTDPEYAELATMSASAAIEKAGGAS